MAITKTRLFKCIETFPLKAENFQMKNSDIYLISAQNVEFWVLVRIASARQF